MVTEPERMTLEAIGSVPGPGATGDLTAQELHGQDQFIATLHHLLVEWGVDLDVP